MDESKKLYELVPEMAALAARIEDGEEIEDVEAQLDALALTTSQKLENIRRLFIEWDAYAAKLKKEEQRLAAIRKPLEKAHDRLHDYVKHVMIANNVPEIKTDLAKFTLRNGKRAVIVEDEMLVPTEFTRVKTEISVDKDAVLAAFDKDGEIVAGTRIEKSVSLVIK